MNNDLETFYDRWQGERTDLIDFDNACAVRKVEALVRGMPVIAELGLRSAIDFGCGRGQALAHFMARTSLDRAHGFDFSTAAVEYANTSFGSDKLQFRRLSTLEIDASMAEIRAAVPEKADCVLLLDVLEHVADCRLLVSGLADLATYFVIKLPVERNLLENYILRNKIYPSPSHYNGHLREFSPNSVFYFIRELGLAPLAEGLYLYEPEDLRTPGAKLDWRQRASQAFVSAIRKLCSLVLHRKLFMAICGQGGYYCVATFNKNNVLNP